MTTFYNLTDVVIKARKRPSSTSSSASITRPIFGASAIKDFSISIAINAYNHYMSEVDIANQLNWQSKHLQLRSFETDITNIDESREQFRRSKTQ